MDEPALSPQARARLARGVGQDPYEVPDLVDIEAVQRWRSATNRAWGEDSEPGEPPHVPVHLGSWPALRAGSGPPLLYLHGGAFVLGSPGVAIPITARLAGAFTVWSLDYPLAPEHPYPAALHAALDAFEELTSEGQSVVVAGDSAGANLALALALALQSERKSQVAPTRLTLLSPLLEQRVGGAFGDVYRAGAQCDDPLISPLLAPQAWLDKLPPTLVQSGSRDPLFGQAERFAARAPTVRLDVWPGLWHAWQYHRDLPEADAALQRAIEFLRED